MESALGVGSSDVGSEASVPLSSLCEEGCWTDMQKTKVCSIDCSSESEVGG